MRSHHAPPRPPPELPWAIHDQLPPESHEHLIYDATWTTGYSMADYRRCQTCGSGIGWGECTAHAKLPDGTVVLACWRCLVAILVHRHLLDPDGADWPLLYAHGSYRHETATLRPDAGQHRPS